MVGTDLAMAVILDVERQGRPCEFPPLLLLPLFVLDTVESIANVKDLTLGRRRQTGWGLQGHRGVRRELRVWGRKLTEEETLEQGLEGRVEI